MAITEVEAMKDERTLSPTKIDKIKKMRADGFTIEEIVRALKVSPKTVMKYGPESSLMKVEQALVPQQFIVPKELMEAAAKLGLTPVFEETSRRIYFKRLE